MSTMIRYIRNYIFSFFLFILSTYCASAQYPQLDSKGFLINMEDVNINLMVQPLLMEKELPIYLFGAMGINNRNHSMNIAVPLNSNFTISTKPNRD